MVALLAAVGKKKNSFTEKEKQTSKQTCMYKEKKKQKQEAMKESPPHSKDRKISTR